VRVALLVPGPFDALSGGYEYDRRMVEGLRALGHEAEVVELSGRHPLPDDAALAAAREAFDALPPDAVPVVDGLGLPAFAPLGDALARRGAVALIHHPTALETGFPEADREALRETERALFGRVARLVATSPLTARRLVEDFGADPERVGVVEPGPKMGPVRRVERAGASVEFSEALPGPAVVAGELAEVCALELHRKPVAAERVSLRLEALKPGKRLSCSLGATRSQGYEER